jgi:K+-transporting ATPase ATPase A chain
MTLMGWLQIGFLFIVLLGLTKPVGLYLYTVYEKKVPFKFLSLVEERFFRLCGIKSEEQDWKQYVLSLFVFNVMGVVLVFLIEMTQYFLPLNPQNLPGLSWDLALNTAVSFVTNTDWQAYSGEITMSYFTQMTGLTWQNFVSASTGIAAFLALARGLTNHGISERGITVGNFWVDLMRSILYVFLPAALILSLILVGQGVIQNFYPPLEITTLEGAKQTLAMGPVASQDAIKILGTNGGGFFNANSSHPFENPTPLTNYLQILCFLLIPAGLTYTYGKMARNTVHGWSILTAMVILALIGVLFVSYFESQPNPVLSHLPLNQELGNLEGKEVRFGVPGSSLFASLTTDTSCGATNSQHDSFTPMGGLILLVNMMIGEVIFGGVGMGLFGMLMFVIISVFIAGLMVGRTPEYLGKKIEGKEVRFAILYVALYPLLILLGTSWSILAPYGLSSIQNPGPHGLSEVLYAFTSAAQNNGSAFAGLNGNTLWYNVTLALVMFLARFGSIFLGIAIAGAMVNKKILAVSSGTFPTQGILFIFFLLSIILIVGALTYFPVLVLGPFTEWLSAFEGRTF